MEVFRADTSSTNGLAKEERNSSSFIHNIVHKEGNTVVQTESSDNLLAQHDDGFPIITSVFSLASSSNEIKTENHNLNMELIDNKLTFAPLIPKTVIPNTFDYSEKDDYSPVVSSFVVKCNQDDAITVSSQTRTTGAKNEDINPGFQNFLAGCYVIAGSDTKLSNLLRVNGTAKDINPLESQSEVFDNKVEDHATNLDSALSWKISPQCSTEHNYLTAEQPNLVATCNTADATNVGIMTEREERIHRLKDLLRQKEAEVEKVRFLSKKSTLSATIDKIKLRLSTRNDSLGNQTSLAHPNKESGKLPPNAPNLDQEYMYGCDGLLNLVLDGNVGKETNINTVENTNYQNNANESSDHPKMFGTSACLEERRIPKVNEKLWLGTTMPYLYAHGVHENIVTKNENQRKEEENISTTTTEDRKQSAGNPKKRRGHPKKTSSTSNVIAKKTKRLADRNKNASSHSAVSSAIVTSTFLHPTFIAHSYYNEASSGNSSKSSMPPPSSISASLNYPVHYALNATDISHANPASSNHPVDLQNSIGNVESRAAVASPSNVSIWFKY